MSEISKRWITFFYSNFMDYWYFTCFRSITFIVIVMSGDGNLAAILGCPGINDKMWGQGRSGHFTTQYQWIPRGHFHWGLRGRSRCWWQGWPHANSIIFSQHCNREEDREYMYMQPIFQLFVFHSWILSSCKNIKLIKSRYSANISDIWKFYVFQKVQINVDVAFISTLARTIFSICFEKFDKLQLVILNSMPLERSKNLKLQAGSIRNQSRRAGPGPFMGASMTLLENYGVFFWPDRFILHWKI